MKRSCVSCTELDVLFVDDVDDDDDVVDDVLFMVDSRLEDTVLIG